MRLHHVGVAVADLEPAIEMYTSLFGAELTHRASNEKDGLEAAILRMGDAEIELLAPLRDDSAVGQFLAKRGPGMHHVASAWRDTCPGSTRCVEWPGARSPQSPSVESGTAHA